MPNTLNFLEFASGASGIFVAFASAPTTADNAIIRVESGTIRWSETSGSWLSATAGVGLLLSTADQPFRVGAGVALSAFGFRAVGGAGSIQVAYYSYKGIGAYI